MQKQNKKTNKQKSSTIVMQVLGHIYMIKQLLTLNSINLEITIAILSCTAYYYSGFNVKNNGKSPSIKH